MDLISRPEELERLRSAFKTSVERAPQMAVIYGRRQVGKTTLVQQFLDQLPRSVKSISFVATEEADERNQLERLRAAASAAGLNITASTWHEALDQISAETALHGTVVVAFDEVPYLQESSPGWASILQAWWDSVRREDLRLMVILTGSAVAIMQQWLGPSGPLFQRANTYLSMQPLALPQCHELLGGGDPTTTIEAVAACGGFPGYLSLWDTTITADENLEQLAFSSFSPLNFAGRRQMADAPSRGGYHAVLRAMARGLTRFSQINSSVEPRVDNLLETLEYTGFIRRVVPIDAKTWSKKARYELADPFVKFWFTFIYPDAQLIESGQGRAVQRRLAGEWAKHLGWVFEEEARKHAIALSNNDYWGEPLLVGRYWSNRAGDIEIDVCGLRRDRTALVGEAKWSTEPVGIRQLEVLRTKAARAPKPVPEPRFAYWSRGQLTDDLRRSGELTLFGPADMVQPPA